MIEDPPLLQLKRNIKRPSSKQVKALAKVSTGVLVDCLGGRAALNHTVKPINPEASRFAGVAITCDAGPADNLAVFGAIHLACEGDVVVIATGGYMATAVIGDMVLGLAKNAGVTAMVTDGCVRDSDGICKVGLPCFASGVTPDSPARNGPGSAGLMVTVAGRQVNSGDVIVGDKDGVVVVPFCKIDLVINRLESVMAQESALESRIAEGLSMPEFAGDVLSSDRVRWVD